MKRFFLLLTLFISNACAAPEKLDLAAANELAHTIQSCADRLGIESPAEIQVFLEKQAPIPTREEFIQAIRLILEVAVSRELGLEGTGITRSATCAKPTICPNPCPPVDLSEIIGLLLQIRTRIGSVSDPVCANTVLGVLGDACNILGVSISEAISEELACCALTNSLLRELILGGSITATLVFDLTAILTSIQEVQNTLTACCAATQNNFNSTFTELTLIYTTEVAGFNGTFTAIAACCNNTQTNFNGTFTELNLIYTTIVNGFNGTFTELSLIFNTMVTDFNGTWTQIAACCNSTQTELNLIYTTLVNGFNGTFTELTLIYTTMVTDFNGVFTSIKASTCDCNSIFTELNLIYTTLVADFNGTWTQIATGFNGTFTELNLIYTTMVADFNGTWTMINACCNSTQTELNLIYTTLVAGFNGTFTELTLIYTTMVTDFNGVFTALVADTCDCNGIFTELNLIYTTEVAGFNGTFTAIQDVKNTIITDFNGTWTQAAANFNGTATELVLIYTTLVADFNGTFTALSACCNATQTELNLIYTTLVADFNGTWTMINAGFNGTFTELNLIYTTMVTDFNGVFTALAAEAMTVSALYANICSPSLITQANLPVTLSNPGRYILVENANYAPGAATPAVTIASSNVTFDMLCFTIQQTNATAGVNGITVNNTLSNIKIRNGQLKNFTQTGIAVGTGESGVSIDGVTVNGAQVRGIAFAGTAAAPITESSVTNCSAINCCSAATADNVLTLSNCFDFDVSDCLFNKNGSTAITGTLAVVKVSDSQKCQFSDIEADDNTGQFDYRSFSLSNAVLCTFKDCTTKNNLAGGGGSKARGFFLEGAATGLTPTGNIFDNCVVLQLTATSVTDGFLSDTNCNDNLFTNCLATNLMARDVSGVCHGYRAINNNRNRFRNCLALTCTSLSTVAAPFYGTYGFKIDSTTSTGITDCTASDNTAAVAGRGVGFFWFQTTAATCFNCIANRNTFGFDATNLTFNNQSFVQNLAQKNTGAVTQYAGFPAGAKADSVSAATVDSSKLNAWTNVGIA